MPSSIIHYQNSKALQLLPQIGSYIGFAIDAPNATENAPQNMDGKIGLINGIPYQRYPPSID